MDNCLLCQINDADKTGSHIIPSFLMKRINGGGQRDHEIGFVMKNCTVDTYFGRDIYEEQRTAITSDEEKLDSRNNYDVKDHILCKKCETYFSGLESKYATSINLKFASSANTINTKVLPCEALLFWCSIIWRVSVTGHLGKRLHPDLEERLRSALATNDTSELNIHYALFRCKDYSNKTGMGTSVCMDIKDSIVLLFVDEYMLVMLFDMVDEKSDAELFEIGITLKKDSLNNGLREEEIAPLPIDVFSQLMYSVIRVSIEEMCLPEKFNELHKHLFGEKIPQKVLSDVFKKLQEDCKLGDKYTIQNYSLCYKEALRQNGFIMENDDGTLVLTSSRQNYSHL